MPPESLILDELVAGDRFKVRGDLNSYMLVRPSICQSLVTRHQSLVLRESDYTIVTMPRVQEVILLKKGNPTYEPAVVPAACACR